MARSAREFAKLTFETSLGSWRHVRGMARSARARVCEIDLGNQPRQLEARAGYGAQRARVCEIDI